MKRQKFFRYATYVVVHSLIATVPSSNKNLNRIWTKLRMAVYFFILLTKSFLAQAQDQQTLSKGLLIEAPAVEGEAVSTVGFITSQIIFEETFDNGGISWPRSGSWEVGTWIYGANSSYSTIELATTNLSGNYSNDANAWLISPTITLPPASFTSRLTLSFSEWFQLESNYDYGYVKISTDDGHNWVTLSARDGSSNWRAYRIDLTAYANRQIKLAFQLDSDASIAFRGWAIDDVQISRKVAAPLTATMTSLNSQNFPFIYANVAVDTFGVGLPSLTQANFKVYENNVLQQNFFQITPPTIGGGVRLADIVFVLDVSTSMAGEIAAVKSNMLSFVNSLATSGIDYRVGFVVYANSNYVYNGGNLYSSQSTISSTINNVALDEHGVGIGNTKIPEDGFDALYAASLMNFRPSTQKILILITDAPCHYFNDGLDYSSQNEGNLTSFILNTIVSQLKSRSISCFVAGPTNSTDVGINTTYGQFISLYPKYSGQFSGPGSLSSETNGKFYIVTSDFRDILNDIATTLGNNYIVTYKSSNPIFDGAKRNVSIEVTYRTYSDTANGSYIPGAAPSIRRTPATMALSDKAQVAGSTLTIAAEITDTVAPFVQNATLVYRATGTANYSSLTLSPVGSNIYQAVISGNAVIPPGSDYYITATDGQVTSSDPSVDPANEPYQIAVLPNQPPQITHTPVTEAKSGDNISITATVVDNTNFLSKVELYYRKFGTLLFNIVTMSASGVNQFSGVISGNNVTTAGVEYYIRATDNFGVAVTHGIHFITTNPLPCTTTFADDFNDGNANGWRPNTSAQWSIASFNGDPAYCLTVADQVGDEFSLLDGNPWGDFIMEVDAQASASSNKNFFIIFGVANFTTGPSDSYYLQFGPGGVNLYRSVASNGVIIASNSADFASDNQFHNVRIERASPNIKVLVDGGQIINVNDVTITSGLIGFGSFKSTACFDDVSITCLQGVGPVVYNSHVIDDDNAGNSRGDGDGRAERGERVELAVRLNNQGSQTVTGVTATLSASDPDVTIFDDDNYWPDIPGNSSQDNLGNFGFDVNPNLSRDKSVSFTITIKANNAGPWTSTFAVPIYFVPLLTINPPTNLTAVALNSNTVQLAWRDNSDNEDRFNIERKVGAGGAYSLLAALNQNTTSFVDTKASVNQIYYYRARAYSVTANSEYSNEAIAQTPPARYGTTVITHGFRRSSNNLENDGKWILTMAKAIAEQLGGGQVYAINQGRIDGPLTAYSIGTFGEKIIVFNWLEESDKPVFGYTEAAGDACAAVLIEGAMANKWSLAQLHFIGHSRGTVVLSEAIERLALYTKATNGQLPSGLSIDNKIHFTTLDAHPWDNKAGDQIGDLGTAWDYSVNSANLDQGVVCWENVAYADNYWQKKLFDLNGLSKIKGGSQTTDLSNLNSMSHTGVHVWYHGTIDRNAFYDDAGDSIYVLDWYPNDSRLALGFNQTVAINAKMDGLKTTETVPVIDDKTLVISQIFNGDFSKRDQGAFIPGWEGHGGGGTGVAEDTYVWFNPYLKLDEVNNYRGHNKFYVPVSAEKIWFRMQVMKKSADDLLVVLIDGRLAYSRNVNTKTSYEWCAIDAVPLRGKAHTLDFTLLNKNSNQDNATLFIDDVGFKRIEYISAFVASPVYLHAYDSRGYHTGPTTDSTWVAEIPGSEYYPEGDSPSKTRQTIILPKPPNGITYSFRIESKKTTGNFSFQVEDVTNAAQTISVFFDSVAIQPNTIATYNMASGISGNTLAIDRNGDGIFEANVAPSRYFQNFTIIATAEPNGAITPADTNFVLFNESAIFSVTANAGYRIADILVDDRSVGPVSSYTFPSVKENHTIHARFSRTTAVHEPPIIPTEYTLYQNHPNPFNPETNIEFALPKPEQVRLRIFDVRGREVRSLLAAPMPEGLHAVKWDGRDDSGAAVGSGVYFYHLQAGSFTETKKLVLMR